MQPYVNKDRKIQLKYKSNYIKKYLKSKGHMCIQTNLRIKIMFQVDK